MKQEPFIESAHKLISLNILIIIITIIGVEIFSEFYSLPKDFHFGLHPALLLFCMFKLFIINSTINRLCRENYIDIQPNLINIIYKLCVMPFIVILQIFFSPIDNIIILICTFYIEKNYRKDSNFSFINNFLPNVYKEVYHCIKTVIK